MMIYPINDDRDFQGSNQIDNELVSHKNIELKVPGSSSALNEKSSFKVILAARSENSVEMGSENEDKEVINVNKSLLLRDIIRTKKQRQKLRSEDENLMVYTSSENLVHILETSKT